MKILSVLFVLFLLSITLFGVFFTENSAEGAMLPRLFRRSNSGCNSCANGSCSRRVVQKQINQTKQNCQNCQNGVCTKPSSSGVEVDTTILFDVDNKEKDKCCDCKCGCPNCKCATECCKDNNGKCNCTCGCKSCKCCNKDVNESCTSDTCSSNRSASSYSSRTVTRTRTNYSVGKGRIRAFIKKILHRN